MMTIADALAHYSRLPQTDTARLDTELLLAHALGESRTFLYSWPQRQVPAAAGELFLALLERRVNGEPIAYLLGQQEFWSLPLKVNNATLIPRPETELLVELALSYIPPNIPPRIPSRIPSRQNIPAGQASIATSIEPSILDMGTGSGAIALALATERPDIEVVATDNCPEALAQAHCNAQELGLENVSFIASNWFNALKNKKFDLIVSNPPYIATDDPHLTLADVAHEPRTALVSGPQGLDDISVIAAQARAYLKPNGWLLLEHGFEQSAAVRNLLQQAGFSGVDSYCDLAGHDRVSGGCCPA